MVAAVATVTAVLSIYGVIAYLAYGEMKEQMVTQMLPKDSAVVRILVFLNVVILIFTYPLTINPANSTFETMTVDKWFP